MTVDGKPLAVTSFSPCSRRLNRKGQGRHGLIARLLLQRGYKLHKEKTSVAALPRINVSKKQPKHSPLRPLIFKKQITQTGPSRITIVFQEGPVFQFFKIRNSGDALG